MTSLRLGIDLDGVVADFNAGWISRYNNEFGADLAFDAVTAWDGLLSMTHFRRMEEFWEWARDHDGHSLFRHLDTYPGAVTALERLTRGGHQVVIITTKPWWAIHDTFEWLAQHRIPTREVHMTHEKWLVSCDLYLDDAPHVLSDYTANRPEATVCRFVRPWNEPVPGTVDVSDWEEFESLVASRVQRGLRSH